MHRGQFWVSGVRGARETIPKFLRLPIWVPKIKPLSVLSFCQNCSSDCKESACNTGDLGSIPGSGEDPLEKETATHSSVLAWRIPWIEDFGRLQSVGSQRIGHDWVTPVILPRKSHGWRSLVGCSPWGCEESDTTEQLHFHFSLSCIGEGNGNPVFLPGESQGWGSPVGCHLWGRTKLDTTEAT